MNTLLILVGSQRPDGFNHALARAAEALLAPGWRAETFDALALLPHLREDLDEPGQDATLDRFRDAVRRSDAILFVTPEYNGGPPSLIKNALDHASRPRRDAPIAGMPAAVIGATPTPGATAAAREALIRGLAIAHAAPVEATFGVAEAHLHLDAEGYDAAVRAGLRPVLDALLAAAHRPSPTRDDLVAA